MSAGPDELQRREFREASGLISDPLQAFFEEAQATAEVLKARRTQAPRLSSGWLTTSAVPAPEQQAPCWELKAEASCRRNDPVICSAGMTPLQYCSSLWPLRLSKHIKNLERARSKAPKIIAVLAKPRIGALGLPRLW